MHHNMYTHASLMAAVRTAAARTPATRVAPAACLPHSITAYTHAHHMPTHITMPLPISVLPYHTWHAHLGTASHTHIPPLHPSLDAHTRPCCACHTRLLPIHMIRTCLHTSPCLGPSMPRHAMPCPTPYIPLSLHHAHASITPTCEPTQVPGTCHTRS
jgi:hypothetical protein